MNKSKEHFPSVLKSPLFNFRMRKNTFEKLKRNSESYSTFKDNSQRCNLSNFKTFNLNCAKLSHKYFLY